MAGLRTSLKHGKYDGPILRQWVRSRSKKLARSVWFWVHSLISFLSARLCSRRKRHPCHSRTVWKHHRGIIWVIRWQLSALLPFQYILDSTVLGAGWTQRSESTLVPYRAIDKRSGIQEMWRCQRTRQAVQLFSRSHIHRANSRIYSTRSYPPGGLYCLHDWWLVYGALLHRWFSPNRKFQ